MKKSRKSKQHDYRFRQIILQIFKDNNKQEQKVDSSIVMARSLVHIPKSLEKDLDNAIDTIDLNEYVRTKEFFQVPEHELFSIRHVLSAISVMVNEDYSCVMKYFKGVCDIHDGAIDAAHKLGKKIKQGDFKILYGFPEGKIPYFFCKTIVDELRKSLLYDEPGSIDESLTDLGIKGGADFESEIKKQRKYFDEEIYLTLVGFFSSEKTQIISCNEEQKDLTMPYEFDLRKHWNLGQILTIERKQGVVIDNPCLKKITLMFPSGKVTYSRSFLSVGYNRADVFEHGLKLKL